MYTHIYITMHYHLYILLIYTYIIYTYIWTCQHDCSYLWTIVCLQKQTSSLTRDTIVNNSFCTQTIVWPLCNYTSNVYTYIYIPIYALARKLEGVCWQNNSLTLQPSWPYKLQFHCQGQFYYELYPCTKK